MAKDIDATVEKLYDTPEHKQAIKLLQKVWDDFSSKETDEKLVQDVWLEWTDNFMMYIRGEM